MQSKKLAGNKPDAKTQHYLDIAEIRNDTVILKDGTLRKVLLVSSINFALKSEDEQQAIISSYMGFMNSFTFPVQIVIQSRKLNIAPYIEKLKRKEEEQLNDLLRMQIADYRRYIGELVDLGDIMTKSFYIVLPYSPLSDTQKSFWDRVQEVISPTSLIKLKDDTFKEYTRVLNQRVEHIMMGLSSMGLQAAVLDTQSLIELYYNMYNPQVSQHQKMTDISKLRLD
jgi:hypothetical protein